MTGAPSGTVNGTARAALPDVQEVLGWARSVTGPVLERAVAELPEPVRTVARYHFGWRDARGNPAAGDWGKGVRGALVLASAQALDPAAGPPLSAPAAYRAPGPQPVRAAAVVELVHNFSLLHDDFMDDDRLRRGRPTAWVVFGDAKAVLAGDALMALSMKLLTESEGPLPAGTDAVRELADALLALVAGQGEDLVFESRSDVREEDCLRMADGKTASLLAAACALGAKAVGAAPEQVGALRAFGRHIGLAFQLADDLLGVWGDSALSGKAAGGDLRRRKRSFPVVAAIRSGTTAGRRLAGLYRLAALAERPLTDREVVRATALVEEAGGRELTRREADRQRARALDCLATAVPDPGRSRVLAALAEMAVDRRV
ncbi:polyprenyl synthetase family protein [Actinacidiphila alni]|uniref:polyprenyl synthetase family protein n=1 Tax=Actinacidiphila alni TaxID=380248 RepID=UPI0033CA9350